MELLANRPLHNHVLLVLVILLISLEMKLVVISIWNHNFSSLHVHRDRQNALQREVLVLNVTSIDLFVLVEQVGVLKLFDWLFGDFRDPVVHAKSTILNNHLL